MKKLILSLFVFLFALENWAQVNVTPKPVIPISAKSAKPETANTKNNDKAGVVVQETGNEEHVVGNPIQTETPVSSANSQLPANSGGVANNINQENNRSLSSALFPTSNNTSSKEPSGASLSQSSLQGRPNPVERKKIALPKDVKEPDDSGIIMLVRLIELSAVAMTNPFEIRVQPTIATIDTEIFVGGIIHGETAEKDSVIINGNVFSTDEFVSGFRIYSIRESNVILEYKDKLLIVPRDKKIIIRLPQQI